ncbi:MAG: hypothetical protein COY94_06895 [Verrucomicrobia bacterium CG_4_10_14_0_8_um_filter_43_34]|nr:MAG: hypothetical protein AUJ82_05160 [Verrucomicrobia bacterium CG1_02_43_26]PIY61121.1 MAG: hypothetical protein COY94_06895 [Verrucomicrobia bacterium CG_4_10_14_0_8_um_filter_43_34]
MNNFSAQVKSTIGGYGLFGNLVKPKEEKSNGEGVVDVNGNSRSTEDLKSTKKYMIDNYGSNNGVVGSVRDWEDSVEKSGCNCNCCSGCMSTVKTITTAPFVLAYEKCVPESVKEFGQRNIQSIKDVKHYLVDENNNLECTGNVSTIMGTVGGVVGGISPLLTGDYISMGRYVFYGSLGGMALGGFVGLGLDMVSEENRETIENFIPNNLKMSSRSVSNYSALGNNIGTVIGGVAGYAQGGPLGSYAGSNIGGWVGSIGGGLIGAGIGYYNDRQSILVAEYDPEQTKKELDNVCNEVVIDMDSLEMDDDGNFVTDLEDYNDKGIKEKVISLENKPIYERKLQEYKKNSSLDNNFQNTIEWGSFGESLIGLGPVSTFSVNVWPVDNVFVYRINALNMFGFFGSMALATAPAVYNVAKNCIVGAPKEDAPVVDDSKDKIVIDIIEEGKESIKESSNKEGYIELEDNVDTNSSEIVIDILDEDSESNVYGYDMQDEKKKSTTCNIL